MSVWRCCFCTSARLVGCPLGPAGAEPGLARLCRDSTRSLASHEMSSKKEDFLLYPVATGTEWGVMFAKTLFLLNFCAAKLKSNSLLGAGAGAGAGTGAGRRCAVCCACCCRCICCCCARFTGAGAGVFDLARLAHDVGFFGAGAGAVARAGAGAGAGAGC
eukprot:COSAG05_NODE_1236_length_5437_cov_15.230611_4_plen_161_part_00